MGACGCWLAVDARLLGMVQHAPEVWFVGLLLQGLSCAISMRSHPRFACMSAAARCTPLLTLLPALLSQPAARR